MKDVQLKALQVHRLNTVVRDADLSEVAHVLKAVQTLEFIMIAPQFA